MDQPPARLGRAQAVALVTAELACNAITHGRLPGRDFRLTPLLLPDAVRIEVTDPRPENRPAHSAIESEPIDATTGRGLLLVEAYADHWGCTARDAYNEDRLGRGAAPYDELVTPHSPRPGPAAPGERSRTAPSGQRESFPQPSY
ncbi:ATP-binding protein [Streptomyces sp. NRRL S-1824]|uniref:ATP-binding protein n=1 Tax=Streptomyces sp. NRRL S-1824 TaxID=1463889 RepID=UPI002D21E56F|nr:ATP-binding protein [Streptomyces sp. NRRL S-1824]